MWNGLYYKFGHQDGGLIGVVHDMDMNSLSVPPDPGNLRPLGPKHLELADPDSHWLPYLTVTPKD